MLGVPLLGLIPESEDVLVSTNLGKPVICTQGANAAGAYQDFVHRFLGEEVPLRFVDVEKKGLLSRMFG